MGVIVAYAAFSIVIWIIVGFFVAVLADEADWMNIVTTAELVAVLVFWPVFVVKGLCVATWHMLRAFWNLLV